jgi:hypothetical protein
MLNPFASPQSSETVTGSAGISLDPKTVRSIEIGQAFAEWERLRVWYNGVLAVVALLAIVLVSPRLLLDAQKLWEMATLAVAANVCFFAGNIVDCYATWLFGRLRWIRPLVFTVGTAGSVLLTAVSVLLLEHGVPFHEFG